MKKRIGALFLLVFCLTSAVSCRNGTDDVYALVTALSESFGEDHGPSLMYSDKAAMGFTEVGHETLGRLYLGKWESPACASRIESFAIRLPLDDSGFEIHALKCVNASDTDEISGLIRRRIERIQNAEIKNYAPESYERFFVGAEVFTYGNTVFLLATPDNLSVKRMIKRGL